MLETVAAALGNTPAISRKSYIHPALIALCSNGDAGGLCQLKLPRATQWLTPHERALVGFLDEIAQAAREEIKAA
jgi:DNA topoisomerase I